MNDYCLYDPTIAIADEILPELAWRHTSDPSDDDITYAFETWYGLLYACDMWFGNDADLSMHIRSARPSLGDEDMAVIERDLLPGLN